MRKAILIFALCIPAALSGQAVTGAANAAAVSSKGMPSGAVMMLLSGTCPTNWTESTALDGFFLQGTIAAHGDVGTTGGNSSITPAGTVSQPTLSMNPYTPAGSVAAPTFTGSNGTTSAVSAGTPAGTNSTASFTPAGTNSAPAFTGTPATLTGTVSQPTFTGSAMSTHQHELPFQDPSAAGTTNFRGINPSTFGTGTSRAGVWGITTTASTTAAAVALSQAVSAGTPAGTVSQPTLSMNSYTPAGSVAAPTFTGNAGTVPAETFSGSALPTHTHTLTPAGTNSAPVFSGSPATLAGVVSQPTFAGQAFDPRPLFIRVIFCVKD